MPSKSISVLKLYSILFALTMDILWAIGEDVIADTTIHKDEAGLSSFKSSSLIVITPLGDIFVLKPSCKHSPYAPLAQLVSHTMSVGFGFCHHVSPCGRG